MTIKELIDELSKYNEQLEVLLQTQESEDVGVEPRVVLKSSEEWTLMRSP